MINHELPAICANCKDFEECTVTVGKVFSNEILQYATCVHAVDCEKLDDAILEEELNNERTNS